MQINTADSSTITAETTTELDVIINNNETIYVTTQSGHTVQIQSTESGMSITTWDSTDTLLSTVNL